MSKPPTQRPTNNPGPGVPVTVKGETATVRFGEQKG